MAKINTTAVQDKVKEFKKFLNKKKIQFEKFEPSIVSKLYLKETTINSRSSYNQKIEASGITPLLFEMIKKFIQEVNLSHEVDSMGLRFEKIKLNNLLVKTDRTLKNSKLNIRFCKHSTFGGFTESRTKITLFDPDGETISEYLKIVPGINYHEMGHVLYTCSFRKLKKDIERMYTEYDPDFEALTHRSRESVVGAILRIINVFEDGRVENLMGNKFGTTISYFKNSFYEFLFKQIAERQEAGEEISEMDCVLVAARKYVDEDIRKWIFEKYMECNDEHTEEKAIRVNSYINKYITMSWRKNKEEILDLVLGFFFEFIKPELEKNKENEWEQLVQQMIIMESEMNQMGEGEDGDIDESEERILGKILKDAARESKPSKKPSKKKGEKSDSEDSGNSSDKSNEERDKEIRDKARKESNKSDKEVERETEELKKQLGKTKLDDEKNGRHSDKQVSIDMKKSRILLEKKLQEFLKKCRNGFINRKKSGGVDIGEARRQEYRGGMKIFRQYRRNVKKALDIDVAFVLDCSYSMAGNKIEQAAQQLWVSSTACATVGAKVKTFTFSDSFLGTVDQPKQKNIFRAPHAINGTTISDTLLIAENYLNCSTSNTKWLVVLTDGDVSDPEMHDILIGKFKRKGITCGKINFMGYCSENNIYDHILNIDNCYSSNDLLEGKNIVSFFKRVYEISLQKVERYLK